MSKLGPNALGWVEQALLTRGGGAVQRCHGTRHTGSYSNAEHSWGVAMLIWHLFPDQFRRMAIFALCHDVPECLVGDMPSTAKESSAVNPTEDAILEEFGLPKLCMLGPKEHAILKVCDRLELYLWAKEQLAQGNAFAQEFLDNLNETFKAYNWNGLESARTLFDFMYDMDGVPNRAGLLRRIKEAHAITE